MIRWQVRKQLAEVIAQAPNLGNVTVTAAYPGDKQVKAEAIFGDRTDGEQTFPYAMGGDPDTIVRDDFTVVFVVRVARGRDLEAMTERCEELVTLIVRRLAETGQDLDGFTVNGEQVHDVSPVTVSTREGEAPSRNGVTPIALAELTIQIQTQSIVPED